MSNQGVDPKDEPMALSLLKPNPSNVSLDMAPRVVKMYPVLDSELSQLRDSSPSLPLTFFGFAFGAAVSFGLVLRAEDGPADAWMVGMFFASAVLTIAFGLAALRAWRKGTDLAKVIKERPPATGL